MHETHSINREFDFVRLDGLRRATGRPAHEWDTYIVKELIDNAIDADEILWQQDSSLYPEICVRIEYISVPERRSRQLYIEVQNRALFPVDKLDEIFSTKQYTSSKIYAKGLTRGALGNALKTLLGIPYALHNRSAGGWKPELKPMTINCQGIEYQPRYIINRMQQEIDFEYSRKEIFEREGTTIAIGVDSFDQEKPRTLGNLQLLATLYRLTNPHVYFRWSVEFDDEEWTQIYEPDRTWNNKYHGLAPIQWYFVTMFQDFLGALYRKQHGEDETQVISIVSITQHFANTTGGDAVIASALGQESLACSDIENAISVALYKLLIQHSSRFDARNLGRIGRNHWEGVLGQALPINGEILYHFQTNDSDLNSPFVLEVAAAYLEEGEGRELWTAVNFSPTYNDPFLRAWLTAPNQSDEPVLGLRGLLDAYDFTEETPFVICFHLICPNVEYSEFSKTDINHLAFKVAIGDVLDTLLTRLIQTRQDAELHLRDVIFKAIADILDTLGSQERFIPGQLLEKLKVVLGKNPEIRSWLKQPEANSRLQAYIGDFQAQDTVLTQRIVRPATGTVTIPLHPDRYSTWLAEHVTHDLLTQHHVNKILYIQSRELEPMVIENQWLCEMDMALLHSLPGKDALRTPLIQLASRCDFPILVLHDANETGRNLVKKMQIWTDKAGIEPGRVIDLGLEPTLGDSEHTNVRLVELMPGELASWIRQRLLAIALPIKWQPETRIMRSDIREQVEESLQRFVWQGIGQHVAWSQLLIKLDQELGLSSMMLDQALEERLQSQLTRTACKDSYQIILEAVSEEFYDDFMRKYQGKLQQLIRVHLDQIMNEEQ